LIRVDADTGSHALNEAVNGVTVVDVIHLERLGSL
jgi:hypothetical protein